MYGIIKRVWTALRARGLRPACHDYCFTLLGSKLGAFVRLRALTARGFLTAGVNFHGFYTSRKPCLAHIPRQFLLFSPPPPPPADSFFLARLGPRILCNALTRSLNSWPVHSLPLSWFATSNTDCKFCSSILHVWWFASMCEYGVVILELVRGAIEQLFDLFIKNSNRKML